MTRNAANSLVGSFYIVAFSWNLFLSFFLSSFLLCMRVCVKIFNLKQKCEVGVVSSREGNRQILINFFLELYFLFEISCYESISIFGNGNCDF